MAFSLLAFVLFQEGNVSAGTRLFEANRGGTHPTTSEPVLPGGYSVAAPDHGQALTLDVLITGVDTRLRRVSVKALIRLDLAKLSPGEAQAQIPTSVRTSIGGLFQMQEVQIPVIVDSRVNHTSEMLSQGVSINLDLWGNPTAYPDDTYGSNNFIIPETRARLRLTSSAAVPTFVMRAGLSGDYLNLLLERPLTSRLWVYAIAVAPFLLFLLLLLRPRSGGSGSVELGVAIIALLPLRQVLVPSEFDPPTRVDLLLAGQLFLMILVLIWRATQQYNPAPQVVADSRIYQPLDSLVSAQRGARRASRRPASIKSRRHA